MESIGTRGLILAVLAWTLAVPAARADADRSETTGPRAEAEESAPGRAKDLEYRPDRRPSGSRPDRTGRRLSVEARIAGGHRTVQVGDRIRFEIDPSEPTWLYVFDIGTSGSVRVLHPRSGEKPRKMGGARPVTLPGADRSLRVRGPVGREHLLVLASREPLQPGRDLYLLEPRRGSDPAGSKDLVLEEEGTRPTSRVDDAVETFLLKVRARHRLAPGDSAHALLGYDVEDRRTKRPVLTVTVRPPGARIHVDGSRAWQSAPHTYDRLSAGTHEILILREGYKTWVESLELQDGTTQTIEVDLEPRY